MIGRIRGKLIEIDGNIGLIETSGGISYNIFLTPPMIREYGIGSSIEPYTYLQVRDDALVLFGFNTRQEHELFQLLLSVPSVGPKTAFSVISFSKGDELRKAVTENDIDYFRRIPGLGKKTAMKIILELSQKFKQEFSLKKMYLSEDDQTVIEALISLGFKSQDAKKLLVKIGKNLSVEDKIKEALKLASSVKR